MILILPPPCSPILSAPQGAQSRARGGPFALLNGAAARDVVVLHVPANLTLAAPIHVLYLSSGAPAAGQASLAAPRLLAVIEEGASAEVVEEFASLAAPAGGAAKDAALAALTAAVAEIELDDRAALKHSYVVLEGADAAHSKATLVNQVGAGAGVGWSGGSGGGGVAALMQCWRPCLVACL